MKKQKKFKKIKRYKSKEHKIEKSSKKLEVKLDKKHECHKLKAGEKTETELKHNWFSQDIFFSPEEMKFDLDHGYQRNLPAFKDILNKINTNNKENDSRKKIETELPGNNKPPKGE